MNKLDTSNETSTKWSVDKIETWAFIQNSNIEALKNIVLNLIGEAYSTSIMYVLHGCVATGTDPGPRTFTAGAVFFNGEIYSVPSASFTTIGSNVAIAKITDVADGVADPTLFSDNTLLNVHRVRTVVISAGLSGSGTADASDFVKLAISNEEQTIGTVAITDETGATDYNLSTFSAVALTKKYKIEATVQHSPSSSQGTTLVLKIKVNGTTIYFLTYQQGNPGATYSKLATISKVLSLNAGDIVKIEASGAASASGVTTINKGDSTLSLFN